MTVLRSRLYKSEDYSTVMQLWKRADLILSLSDKKEELQILADNQGNKFFIFEKDGELIGTAICAFDGRRGYIHHVAVLPRYQNQGIGKQIMHYAMEHYRKKKVVKVHIMIEKSNAKVVSFYEKLGWVVRNDLVLMTKTLRDEDFSLDE